MEKCINCLQLCILCYSVLGLIVKIVFLTSNDRMMMLEEDQISFRSDSLASHGIEDYSHQIAEMTRLRSASNLVQDGVTHLLYLIRFFQSISISLFCPN